MKIGRLREAFDSRVKLQIKAQYGAAYELAPESERLFVPKTRFHGDHREIGRCHSNRREEGTSTAEPAPVY
jgi:hypothetical protein